MSYSKVRYSKLLPHIESAEARLLEMVQAYVRWDHVFVGNATRIVELVGKELEDKVLLHLNTNPSYSEYFPKLSALKFLGEHSEDGCVNVSGGDMIFLFSLSKGVNT